MIKTIFGIIAVTAVSPVLLYWAVEPLLLARGEVFYRLAPWFTFESMTAFTCMISVVVYYTLYKFIIH